MGNPEVLYDRMTDKEKGQNNFILTVCFEYM